MNPQDPLASLNPLREPAAIDWWPLAPGWWALLAIILLVLAALAWFLWRRYRANAYRRRALVQLQGIYTDFEQHRDQHRCLHQINALLKSVALHAYPRRQVAGATGSQWLIFLNESCRGPDLFEARYASAIYSDRESNLDMSVIHESCRQWISRHEVTA
jgi:hypothetical protein